MTEDGVPERFDITDAITRALVDEQFPHLADRELGRRYTIEDHYAVRLGDDFGALFPRQADQEHLYTRVADLIAEPAREWTFPASYPIAKGTPGHGYPYHWVVVRWYAASTAGFVPLHHHAVSDFGRALAEIHQPAPPGAPLNPRSGPGLESLREWFDDLVAFALETGAPEHRELDEPMVRALFEAGAQAELDVPFTWTHGRLEPRAVLSDRGGFAGILMWHNFGAGDPAADLGYASNLVPMDARDQLWRGYGEITVDTAARATAYQVFAALGYIYFGDPFLLRIAWERLLELEAARGG